MRTWQQAKRGRETRLCPGTSSTDFGLPKSKLCICVSLKTSSSCDGAARVRGRTRRRREPRGPGLARAPPLLAAAGAGQPRRTRAAPRAPSELRRGARPVAAAAGGAGRQESPETDAGGAPWESRRRRPEWQLDDMRSPRGRAETPALPPCSEARGGGGGPDGRRRLAPAGRAPARTRVGIRRGNPGQALPRRPTPPQADPRLAGEPPGALSDAWEPAPHPAPAAPRAPAQGAGAARPGGRDRNGGGRRSASSGDGRSRAITPALDGSSTGNLEEEPGRAGGAGPLLAVTARLGGAGSPAACGGSAPRPFPRPGLSLPLAQGCYLGIGLGTSGLGSSARPASGVPGAQRPSAPGGPRPRVGTASASAAASEKPPEPLVLFFRFPRGAPPPRDTGHPREGQARL